jgi:hypothetical protein
MAFTPRFKEKIVDLTTLHDNLAPLLTDMPHLAKDHAALAGVLTQLRELESHQDGARGELRSVNKQRAGLAKEGRKLGSRLTTVMRGTLGPDNTDLVRYGIQPLTPAPRGKRLTKLERAEQFARQAAQVKAELEAEAEAAVKAAAEAQRRASGVGLSTS